MDNLQWIQQFHLIRPYWLLALIPLGLTIWLAARTQTQSRSWASVIDKRLLPHLLETVNKRKKSTPIKSLFLLGCIIIFSLAGPAFEKRPQPVFKTQSALVILLDLSRSMNATDIKPSRLSRAHFKINDILKLRKEGQTALIAYAANAYVVSPLTDDAKTIASQVPALETYIMPAQGSRLDIALEKALELFTNAGQSKGDVLVITDSINDKDKSTIKSLNNKNFKTSILAIGTADGAPIANHNGGFVKDRNGSIVIPKLEINLLRNAALAGGGKFSLLTSNDRDINHILPNIKLDKNKANEEQTDISGNKFKTDIWHEEGPWLLLIIIPFAAYAFRKGLIFALLIFIFPVFVFSWPQPAQAETPQNITAAWSWSNLWSTQDQRAAKALQQGETKQAAKLFEDPQWKAAAQYQSGEYQKAAELLNNIDTPDANYNRGNALAKTNDLDSAIKAYDRALQLNPDHEDAKYNKNLLEQAKQQQQDKNSKNSEDQNNKSQNNKDQQKNPNDSENKNNENNSGEDSQQRDQSGNKFDKEPNEQDSETPQSKQTPDNKNSADTEKEKTSTTEAKENERDEKTSKEELKAQQQSLSEATPDLEQQQAQQWLKKIPDDPGGLLRRKFKYQYSREQHENEQQPW